VTSGPPGTDTPEGGQRRTGRGRHSAPAAGGRLAGDTGWATVAEGATLGSSLVVFYLVTTRLGPGQFGYFAGIQSLVAALSMLSTAWVGLLLLQEVVRESRPAATVFATCLTLSLGAGGLATLIALVVGPWLLPGLAVPMLLLFVLAELLGAGLLQLAAALLQALDRFSASVAARCSLLVMRVIAVLVLALSGHLTLGTLAVTYFALSLLAGTLALLVVRRACHVSLRPARPNRAELRSGMSYAGALVSFAVQEDADKLLLVRLADPVTAGLYAAGYRAVQVAIVPLRALANSSHRTFLQNDPDATGEHLRRSVRFTGIAAAYALVAVVVLVVGRRFVPDLLGEAYRDSVPMIGLLAPLVLFRALSLFAFNGLMGLRRNGVRLGIISAAATVNALLNLVLIATYSWRGAAVATLIAEVVFTVGTWVALVVYQRRHDAGVRARPEAGASMVPA